MNPLGGLNTRLKRRTNVDAVLRLDGPILSEHHTEWKTLDRHYVTIIRATVLTLEKNLAIGLEAAHA